MALPGQYDIDIYQGDHYELLVRIAGWTAAEIAALTWAVGLESLHAGDAGPDASGTATPTGLDEELLVELTSATTSPLEGEYRWDLVATDAGKPKTLLYGCVNVVPRVTSV